MKPMKPMKTYRRIALTVTTCASSFSLAACAAGVTTANQQTPQSTTASHAGSSPAASASQTASAGAGSTIRVNAPVGSFPIPHGAQVVANIPCGNQVLVELDSVTPAQVSGFYAAALPQAGYQITDNTLSSDPSTGAAQGMAELTFTGHGFTGLIIAMANLNSGASADPSVPALPGGIAKNAVEISLSPSGTTGTPTCSN